MATEGHDWLCNEGLIFANTQMWEMKNIGGDDSLEYDLVDGKQAFDDQGIKVYQFCGGMLEIFQQAYATSRAFLGDFVMDDSFTGNVFKLFDSPVSEAMEDENTKFMEEIMQFPMEKREPE